MKKILLIITGLLLLSIGLFGQADIRYDAGMNLPFNEKAGDVNPQTGNLTLSFTDVALPGRAGFNFSFGRIWSLNRSNVFNMYFKDGYNRLNSNTLDAYNRLGTGWSSSMPYIMKDDSSGKMTFSLFMGGSVYQIDTSTLSVDSSEVSNILYYDLTDIRIYTKSLMNYGMMENGGTGMTVATLQSQYGVADHASHENHYVVHLKTNEQYFFSSDGKLMMHQDKTGFNRIWYFYDTDRRLRLVVDTVGREIVFSYDENENLTQIEWDVTIGTKQTDQTRAKITEKRSIHYGYKNAESFLEVGDAQDRVIGYRTPFLLETVTGQGGLVTKYDYQPGEALFTLHPSAPNSSNVYMMLTGITDVYTEEAFKSKRCFEYEVPEGGMFKKEGGSQFMEYYKISRQYFVNKNGRLFNDTRYVYFDKNDGGNSNCYTAIITLGGVMTSYKYTLNNTQQDHVLDSYKVESREGFLEFHDYTYDNQRRKTLEEVYRQGKYVYKEEFLYDDKGNLICKIDKGGLETVIAYNEKYSIPKKQEQTLQVQGEDVIYQTISKVNELGQVTEQTLKDGAQVVSNVKSTYDVYGNITHQENAEGVVVHTIYDQAYNTFPVKIYQHVDIADWTSGDIHTQWQNEPSGTKRVRIRSWKVFNSDGSIWIEVDNEGYAIEHYYDKHGTEIETVNSDLNDVRSFANPIEVNEAGEVTSGTDFDNFALSSAFGGFLESRKDNPGTRMDIDYQQEFVKNYADIDRSAGTQKITGQEADGLGYMLREIEYNEDETEYAVKKMEYDSQGRLSALTDPDASPAFTLFSINGTKVELHDKTWMIKYDSLGRKKMIYYPNTRQNKSDTKFIFYDDTNNVITTIDPEGRTIEEHYDWKGNLVEIVRKGDYKTVSDSWEEYTFEYDKLNRKTSFTDAKGLVTEYVYDARNLLTEQIFRDGENRASDVMEYNILGQLVKKTDRKGQVITFEYDRMGRNTKVLHFKVAGGAVVDTVDMAYDNRGNAVRIANGNLIEHYIYDYANRVITLERKLKDSALRSLIQNRVWNRVTGDTNSDSQIFSFNYIYNDVGMATTMTYPDGSVHNFDYDTNLSRLTAIGENSEDFVTNLEYDRTGVVTKMEYANGTSQSWKFDNRKRINHITITGVGENKLVDMSYSLNGVGDILKINDNEYSYDGFDRISLAKTLIPTKAGQVDLRNLIRYTFGSFNQPGDILYNPDADLNTDGRVNGIDHIMASFDSNKEEYDIESFEYDKSGNRIKLIQNGDEYIYEYGIRNRLERIFLRKKDSAAKILFAEYKYDTNGNTLKRTYHLEDGQQEIIDFSYDTMNRLVSTTKGAEVTSYYYDNAGNRFIKATGEKTFVYLRHGQIAVAMDIELTNDDLAEEQGTLNRYVLSGDLLAGRITTKYTKNTQSGEIDNSVNKYWYHLDQLNSTKAVTKADGSLDCLYEYRAFGEELKRIGEGDAKYSYGGKELDDSTHLYYFNARYYDATIGRFINVDPVQDGMNWYVYCKNNPLSFIDPTGLLNVAVHGGAVGAYNASPFSNSNGGWRGMVDYSKMVSTHLGSKDNVFVPSNLGYRGVGFNANSDEAAEYLLNLPWDKNGDNNLIGFSIGADAVAKFMKKTDANFNLVIIDAAQVSLLTPESLEIIKSKTEHLLIIDHEKDYMNGNGIARLFGGGDRVFGASSHFSEGALGADPDIGKLIDQNESWFKLTHDSKFDYLRINNSHAQDLKSVDKKLTEMFKDEK